MLAQVVSDDQLKVPIETMIMMATSAGIGMMRTQSPRTRIRNSRNTPAAKVDSRPRPPDFTLMTDWPIMAQPAMPPKKPVTKLAMPWPMHSRFLSLRVSSSRRRSAAVSSDSSRPTAATPDRVGKDDQQRFQGERHVGEQEHRQRRRQLAHVADGAHVDARAQA